MKNKNLQGSYTLEAALIVPIVLIVIIASIYYSFYLHDSLVMKSCGYEFVLDTNNYLGKEEEELATLAKEIMESKTILAENIRTSIELENEGMSIEYCGEFSFPFVGLKNILDSSISIINRKTKVSSVVKSEFIRISKVAKDALNIEEEN